MNIKSFKDKIKGKLNKQNVKVFFRKQGLYVLIFLCLVAAGITAIVAWPRDDGQNDQISDSDTDVSVIEAPTLDEELAENEPTAVPSPVAVATPTTAPQNEATPRPVAANNGSGSIKLTRPVKGKIINAYSGDSLVFYATLNVWATHNGIDIQADRGSEVVAALSGTVSDVYSNAADGGVIIISHSGKTETIYAGLEDIGVKEGDKISVGAPVGKVGEMPKELDLGYHVHFEYKINGIWKDPSKYF